MTARITVSCLFLMLLAALSIACNSSGKSAPAAAPPTAVPDAASPVAPSATPLAALPDMPFCKRTDIATAVSSNAATGGQLQASVTLGNRSDTPCQISRVPDLQLLDVHGDLQPIAVTSGQPCPATPFCAFQQPLLLLPDLGDPQSHEALKPGQAGLTLSWRIHDGSGICPTPPPKATAVRLLLQDAEDEVVVDVTSELPGGITPCDGTVQVVGYGPVS